MTADLSRPAPVQSEELTLDDLYYWDPEQRRHIWTDLHMQLFLEAARSEPVMVEVSEGPGIVCYVTNWESLL